MKSQKYVFPSVLDIRVRIFAHLIDDRGWSVMLFETQISRLSGLSSTGSPRES